jgi:outer membrane protein insertion porin family
MFSSLNTFKAQFSSKVDYMSPKQYTIAGIVVDGVRNFDHNLIIQKSKLIRGNTVKVPGEEISNAVRNLWDENLFF